MQTNDPQTQETPNPTYDFQTLDLVVRKWAVQSQFEKDLENYDELKQQYS